MLNNQRARMFDIKQHTVLQYVAKGDLPFKNKQLHLMIDQKMQMGQL